MEAQMFENKGGITLAKFLKNDLSLIKTQFK